MSKVSFIVCGDSIANEELDAISEKVSAIDKRRKGSAEVVLYFTNQPIPQSSIRGVSSVFASDYSSSIKNAIIASDGRRIIFTTVKNLLQDKKVEIFNLAIDAPLSTVGVPYNKSWISKLFGIRVLSKTSYLVVDRNFALEVAPTFKSLRQLIVHADRRLSLLRMKPLNMATPSYIIRWSFFLRPYRTIVNHHLNKFVLGGSGKKREGKTDGSENLIVKYNNKMPVFIISRDRLEPLKKLIRWCEAEELKNIIIIDNASTYPPLLKYYSSIPYGIIKLAENIGQTSPWHTGAVEVYAKDRAFIVTDSDIIPLQNSHGAVKHFCRLLNDYPDRIKAGFGLVIDDIPDTYEQKDYVIEWEKQFWTKEIEKDVYDADIDTTFAVNRQNTPYVIRDSLRTGGRYMAKHETWYTDSKNPSEEMRYYRSHADKSIGSWGIDSAEVHEVYHNHKHGLKKYDS